MKKKLNKIAKDTNLFLRRFIAKQKKSNLICADGLPLLIESSSIHGKSSCINEYA